MKGELTGIDLRADEHREIARLLQHHLPNTEVWAYGSRVKGAARPASDLDLVTFASAGQQEAVSRLREAFDESCLPFRVDLFVWDKVPEEFLKNIEETRVVVQKEKTGCKLPEGWQETTIGEFCPFSYGKNLPKKVRDSLGEVPVFGSNGLVGHHSKPLIQDRGIIIGRKGTVGAVTFSSVPFWPIDTTFYISEDSHRDLRYTFYLLKSLRMEHMNADSAVPGLNRNAAHARKITIPPLPEQKAIAHILGSLDDKIELNRGMNETLEAMAQALFKSWFVDFDPVIDNALAAGNAIPDELKEKAAIHQGLDDERKSLPNDIRRLFPSEFVHTEEMGWIPKGWDIVKLSDLADVTMGQSPPSDTYNDDQVGLPFYQGSTDFGFRFPSIRKFCSAPKRQAKKDDVLLSVRAPVGNLNRAEVQCCIGRGLAAIRSKTGYSSWIFYRCRFLKKYFETFNSEGTVFGSMNGENLRAIKSVHPCKNTLKIYENITAAIDQSIRLRSGAIDSLGELRDTLLLKLLSGEIRMQKTYKSLEELK